MDVFPKREETFRELQYVYGVFFLPCESPNLRKIKIYEIISSP